MKRKLMSAVLSALVVAGAMQAADEPSPKAPDPQAIPLMVRDETAGDWVVERFAGNSTSGHVFFQGAAVEAGGVGRTTSLAVAPDGRVFFPVTDGIAEVSQTGLLRLVVSRQEWKADGMEDVERRGALVAWNPKEECLYFWGNHCLRKLVERPDGTREIAYVAGRPDRPGLEDGPVAQATLNAIGNICINSRGDVFFYDGSEYGQRLRRLSGGVVTTLSDKMRSGRLQDGPLRDAQFNFINLGGLNSIGETDDILYVADHWNYAARRIDLKTEQVSTVYGMRKPEATSPLAKRFNNHADGPALTHASANSGLVFSVYDRFHHSLWIGGPDETRLRWLKDGSGRTVMGAKAGAWDLDGADNPADDVKMTWCWVLAVDDRGRAYVMNGASKTGYWRLYDKKAVSR